MSDNKTSRQFKADATLKVFLEMIQGEASTYPWTNEELDNFSRWTGVGKDELKNKTHKELELLAPFVFTVVPRQEEIYIPIEPTRLEGFEPTTATAYVGGEPTDITTGEDGALKLTVGGLDIGKEVEIAIPAGYQFLGYEQNKILPEFFYCEKLLLMSRSVLHGISNGINGQSATMVYRAVSAVSPSLLEYIDKSDERVRFSHLFFTCGSLQTIPSVLFAGFTHCVDSMFYQTFCRCSNITAIPAGLFSSIKGSASSLFAGTFAQCNSLESVPDDLFAGVAGSASYMFASTFFECYKLAKLPADLFASVTGSAPYLFASTFQRCIGLATIPAGLFGGVRGNASAMFRGSFTECSSLQEIPSGLFSGVSGGANWMFDLTFKWCKSLTAIPSDLFAEVYGNLPMFKSTFSDCVSIEGETPTALGRKLWEIAKGEEYGTGCFKGCTKLSDYNEIPDNWK